MRPQSLKQLHDWLFYLTQVCGLLTSPCLASMVWRSSWKWRLFRPLKTIATDHWGFLPVCNLHASALARNLVNIIGQQLAMPELPLKQGTRRCPICATLDRPGHLQHPSSHHSFNKHALTVAHQGRLKAEGGCKTDPREADCGKCCQGDSKWVCWGLVGGVSQIDKVGQRRSPEEARLNLTVTAALSGPFPAL